MTLSIIEESSYQKYLAHLLSGDKKYCHDLVIQYLEQQIDLKDLYENLFQRSLYEVGDLWESNHISVSIEHLATSITSALLNLVYPFLFRQEKIAKKAVVSCVANEYHLIGAQMVSDFFELNQWNSYFLGANVPVNEFLNMVNHEKPDLIALSLTLYSNMPKLIELLDQITSLSPSIRVLVGGQAFNWGGSEALSDYSNVFQINSLTKLEAFLHN